MCQKGQYIVGIAQAETLALFQGKISTLKEHRSRWMCKINIDLHYMDVQVPGTLCMLPFDHQRYIGHIG